MGIGFRDLVIDTETVGLHDVDRLQKDRGW